MDAPLLSPERSTELAALRRRAYGPDADIAGDPVAQQRLLELEALAHAAEARAVDAHFPAPPDRVAPDPDDELFAEPSTERPRGEAVAAPPRENADAPAASTSTPAATPERAWWRRVPLWAIAAIGGIAIGAAIGFTWPSAGGPPPDLTLGVDPNGGERGAGFTENLDYWGVDAGTVVPHEGFDSIQVWTALGIDESRCLLLSHDGSFLSATCTGSGLDPVLDFTIYDGMSLDLETPLPVGTIVRFVGHEGSVDVWVRPPGGQDPEAISSSADLPSAA